MKVLVTGATGFVGRALLPRLVRDGHDVRAAFHRAPAEAGGNVAWVPWEDDSNDAALAALLGDAEVVVHLAGLAHLRSADAAGAASEFMRVNRDATAALARIAASVGVRRFVYLSSVKACGEASNAGAWTETDPRRPAGPYGESKSQAEDCLVRIASASAMEITILRPPLIYGPGVRANFLSLLKWIDRGLPLPVAGTENQRSLIFVGNLVDVLARCIVHPRASGRTYFVSDGEDVSTSELAKRIGSAMGRPARPVTVPLGLLRIAAVLLGRRGAAERLAGSLVVDASLVRTDLGWRPPYSMAQGLQETVKWYRAGNSRREGAV